MKLFKCLQKISIRFIIRNKKFIFFTTQDNRILLFLMEHYTIKTDVIIYEVHTISLQTFFVWALLLIVHTWNSSPLRSNLLHLQCTCCTVPTTSGRPHGSPLVWACQWPSSQPLSSPQLIHNDSLWAKGISKSHREQGMDYREAEELSWCPSWSNSQWQGWSCRLVYCPGGNATETTECWLLPTESLPELP